ncbi:transporter substrate-binding domain-containing protein [Mumia qirimensis]|uniref:transporter substrate-binding domain-containing protein n=1 Tax=Mumia qirimensis TaxID=3234852 RepID=UPI00351D6954
MKVTGRRLGRAAAAAAGALALTVSMAACGGDDEPAATVDGVELVSDDTLTICTNMPYKPFQYEEGDEIVGFDTDLLTLVADDMGLETEIVDVDWNQVTSGAAFKAGKCDVGMGGMTITDERAKAIAISDPYFEATQALLVKADSGISGLEDLDGKKLGVQVDTTGQIYAEENADKYGYTMPAFDDLSLEITGLQAGRVDAIINDNGVLYDFVKDNPEYAVATEFDTGEEYGFAAEKADNGEKMIDKVNEVLAAAQEDGTYDEIYAKYFGEAPQS